MGRNRYRFGETSSPYFLTCTIVEWLPIFSSKQHADIVLDCWRFMHNERDIRTLAWVLMENHLHWIAAGKDLAKRVGEFKSYTARRIIDTLVEAQRSSLLQRLKDAAWASRVDQEHKIWQHGSYPKLIETDEVMWQKIEYIHNNPLRRGYVDDPTHWRYSSARNYAGQPGLLPVLTDW
jgi:putative transposase